MGLLKESRCLVLNGWQPTGINRVLKVISRTMRGSIQIIDPDTLQAYSFDEWVKKGVSSDRYIVDGDVAYDIPEIVLAKPINNSKKNKVKRYTSFSKKLVWKRDDYTCWYCRRSHKQMLDEDLCITIDHIKPRSKGGQNTFDNTVTCCSECNGKKDSMDIVKFCKIMGCPIPQFDNYVTLSKNDMQSMWARLDPGREYPESWKQFLVPT
jgi:5-methylcytosine-specific restriction endonuclease McrA